MSSSVEVVGAAKLRRTLRQAGVDVQDLKDAHATVARMVEVAAEPRTPRDSGELADTMRSSGTARAAIVRAGNARHPYAGPVHWGWPGRNIHAQPWIDETAEAGMPVWADQYMTALDHIIRAVEGAPGR